jgi:hypothetical protein
MKYLVQIAQIFILLLLVSCIPRNSGPSDSNDFIPGGNTNSGESQVSINAKNTIRSKCIGCHGNFSSFSSDQDFIRAGLVVAGSPSRSKIFIRVSGTSGGPQMPKNQRSLEGGQISDIRFWIEQMQ